MESGWNKAEVVVKSGRIFGCRKGLPLPRRICVAFVAFATVIFFLQFPGCRLIGDLAGSNGYDMLLLWWKS